MATNSGERERLGDLVEGLLNRGYTRAARQTAGAVAQNADRLARRFDDLDAESARLAARGERLTPDNPYMVALLADLDDVLRRNARAIDRSASDLIQSGADTSGVVQRRLALGGASDAQLARIGIGWNVPDPEAVQALVSIADSAAWDEMLRKYADDITDAVNEVAIRGIANGWGPVRTARAIRQVTNGLTVARANNIMRTLQLVSYRRAATAYQVANADIVQRVIRIAVLDGRTCMACWALHGTEIPLGQGVDDHWSGRCTSVIETVGRRVEVPTGQARLDAMLAAERDGTISARDARILDDMRRVQGATMRALERGAARLDDFVRRTVDPVFGAMVTQASLKGVLGGDARQYYARGED